MEASFGFSVQDNMCKEVRVLNIITGGLWREGITSTQLEFMRKIDFSHLQVDFLAVHRNSDDVIKEFESLGCKVIVAPDRKQHPIKYLCFLKKLIKTEGYDVIHVHGSSSLLALELSTAKKLKVPMRIAHSRNTKADNARLDKIFRTKFYKSYTHAFACGKNAGEWLFGHRPFTIIHNGNDFIKFEYNQQFRNEIRNKYEIGNKLVIGYVGNLNNYQKNISFLLDMFARVKRKNSNSLLFLIGDGAYKEEAKQKVESLGITDSVIFTGRVSNVNEYLQGMDVMCLPSFFEGLPNVVLEWQIAGLPCYVSDRVTDECKVTELVEFLPIDKGPELWADKILSTRISDDRTEVSQNACQALREAGFDINENAKLVKSIYMSVRSK